VVPEPIKQLIEEMGVRSDDCTTKAELVQRLVAAKEKAEQANLDPVNTSSVVEEEAGEETQQGRRGQNAGKGEEASKETSKV
jgi:hypothetical protein